MSILLDNREHGLIPLLPTATIKQLPVGDAWILVNEKPVLIIERKTTADFEASFLDGRQREQRTRLLSHCQQEKAKALQILEEGLSGHRRCLEKPALQKLLHRLMLRQGVPVWATTNLEDTAVTLEMLRKQVEEDPKVFEGEQLSQTDVMATTKKANLDDPKTFGINAIQGCPGISAKAAVAIWEATGSWKTLLDMEEKALAEIKVGTRRLGPAVAKRLNALLTSG